MYDMPTGSSNVSEMFHSFIHDGDWDIEGWHLCIIIAKLSYTDTLIYTYIHSPKGLLGTPVQFLINAII